MAKPCVRTKKAPARLCHCGVMNSKTCRHRAVVSMVSPSGSRWDLCRPCAEHVQRTFLARLAEALGLPTVPVPAKMLDFVRERSKGHRMPAEYFDHLLAQVR